MTQAELASQSGYSLRLISKAESGKPVSLTAIEDIGEALSTPDERILVNDLISCPLELAKQFIFGLYELEGEVISGLSHIIHESVKVIFAGTKKEIPFAGNYEGKAEVDRAFRLFFQFLQTPEEHDANRHYEFIADGNRVVCWGESWFHPRGGPRLKKAVDVSILMGFEGGKLVLFDDRFNAKDGSQILRQSLKDGK